MIQGWDYIAGFHGFSFGIFGAIQLFLFLTIFALVSLHGRREKALETSLEFVAPAVLADFILLLFGIPDLFSALILVLVYSLMQKHVLKNSWGEWLYSFISLWILLGIFALLDGTMRWVLTIAMWIVYFLLGLEHKAKNNGKSEKKESSEKKEDKPKK